MDGPGRTGIPNHEEGPDVIPCVEEPGLRPTLPGPDGCVGLGAVLSQEFDGEEHPIVFCKVPVEREAVTIKWTIKELWYTVTGHPFTLVTDYAPLQWIARVKDTNSRITQLFLALQDFTFHVKH